MVCLQADWWNAFSFVGTVFKTVYKFIYDLPDTGEIKYECGNPFIKLKHKKSEMTSKIVTMPQFEIDHEVLFQFEILLSPERF